MTPRTGLLCRGCNTVIVSMARHDFRRCNCGAYFVDGGGDYMKVGCLKEDAPEMAIVHAKLKGTASVQRLEAYVLMARQDLSEA